jgi:uncharacterized protein (TIGR00255 family)
MLKSMTGFSSVEAKDKDLAVNVEIKTLNGRYLDINFRMPKFLSQKEFEIRDIVKSLIVRGTVNVSINLKNESTEQKLVLNDSVATECFNSLKKLNSKLKIKDPVNLENLLHFSDTFFTNEDISLSENEWRLIKKALTDAMKAIDKMRQAEGQRLLKDFQNRIKKIAATLQEIETLGLNRVPVERERLRQRVALLFESDEIDEQRIQMELVLMANKLDISEECVRLHSHIKFFNESLKLKEPVGTKLNFLLQEMNREINTIGSKADDAEISQKVVGIKEELERIREQAQNIE